MALTVPLDAAAAARAVLRWVTCEPPVTGICGYDDEVALAVLAGMRERQLTAPAAWRSSAWTTSRRPAEARRR